MDDVAVVEATEDVQDGVGLTDIGKELVSKALALGRAFHQAGDVHDLALWALPELTQLNKVDFPTLGSPTIPHFKAID